jgi:hypothetical protein
MLQSVIERIAISAGAGAAAIAVAGAIEGVITGAIFHLCLQTPYLAGLRWLLGRGFNRVLEAVGIGTFVGLLFGYVSFLLITLFNHTRAPIPLIKHLLKFGVLGTIIGVVLGAVSGASGGAVVTWLLKSQGIYLGHALWPISPPPIPLEMMLAEAALVGYAWGVILGFITGLGSGLYFGVDRIRTKDSDAPASI